MSDPEKATQESNESEMDNKPQDKAGEPVSGKEEAKLSYEQLLAKLESQEKYANELKQEAISNRLKRKEIESQAKEVEMAKLEEQKKYKEMYEIKDKEIRQLKTAQRESAFKTKLEIEARKAGVQESAIDIVKTLITPDSVIYDEDNNSVVGVNEKLAELKSAHPYIFQTEKPKNPQVTKPEFDGKTQAKSLEDLKGKSKEEIVAFFKKKREKGEQSVSGKISPRVN